MKAIKTTAAIICGMAIFAACNQQPAEKETVIVKEDTENAPPVETENDNNNNNDNNDNDNEEGLDVNVGTDENGEVDVNVDGRVRTDK